MYHPSSDSLHLVWTPGNFTSDIIMTKDNFPRPWCLLWLSWHETYHSFLTWVMNWGLLCCSFKEETMVVVIIRVHLAWCMYQTNKCPLLPLQVEILVNFCIWNFLVVTHYIMVLQIPYLCSKVGLEPASKQLKIKSFESRLIKSSVKQNMARKLYCADSPTHWRNRFVLSHRDEHMLLWDNIFQIS